MHLFNFFKSKSYLGVDIGTSFLKVVQLTRTRQGFVLDNYGKIKFFFDESPMEMQQQSPLKMSDEKIAFLLKKITTESGFTAVKAAFSLPVFAVFATIIELPKMPKEDMEKAIQFEARQYIPVPLSEVSLDFMVLGEERKDAAEKGADQNSAQSSGLRQNDKQKKNVEVLLVAVPNEIKEKYKRIAKLAGLELIAMEMETFPSARSLVRNSGDVCVIIDIGARSTDIGIVDNGFVRISHNFELAGADITKAYGEFSSSDFFVAEIKKKMTGLNLTPGQLASAKGLLGVVDGIISESERIINSYFNKTGRSITTAVLAGGGALLPGLLERFQETLRIPVSIGNPFEGLVYPPELAGPLKAIGPSFAVAVGLAMRR